MEKDSVLILYAGGRKTRNRDVAYPYRSSSDILYLSGLSIENMILIHNSDGESFVVMDMPEEKQERWEGKMTSRDDVIANLGIDAGNIRDHSEVEKLVKSQLANKNTLYLDFTTVSEFPEVIMKNLQSMQLNNRSVEQGPQAIKHIGEIIHEMRVIKNPEELSKIQTAIDITERAYRKSLPFIANRSEELMEYQVKAYLESHMFDQGIESVAYPSIVASGNNATVLHYTKCNSVVESNDLILIDAGAEWQGYAADITRTLPSKGKYSKPAKDLYNIVLEAQEKAIALCKPGSTLQKIHEAALDVIIDGCMHLGLFKKIPDPDDKSKMIKNPKKSEIKERKIYNYFYMHYTSHYLGLDVHDVGKYFVKDQNRKLETAMVFTVEPGIYIPAEYEFAPASYKGIGIRIEDDIALTKDTFINLSKNIPKTINEIESLMKL